jgi:hypothetical protein
MNSPRCPSLPTWVQPGAANPDGNAGRAGALPPPADQPQPDAPPVWKPPQIVGLCGIRTRAYSIEGAL